MANNTAYVECTFNGVVHGTWTLNGFNFIAAVAYDPNIAYTGTTDIHAATAGLLSDYQVAIPSIIPTNAVISYIQLNTRSSFDIISQLTWGFTINGTQRGATTNSATDHAVTFSTNPDTGLAWTYAEIQNGLFGVKTISQGGTATITIHRFRMRISWEDNLTLSPAIASTAGGPTITISGSQGNFIYSGSNSGVPVANKTIVSSLSLGNWTTVPAAVVASATSLSVLAPVDSAGDKVVYASVYDADATIYTQYAFAPVGLGFSGGLTYAAPSWWKLQTATARTSHYQSGVVYDANAEYAYSTDVFWYGFGVSSTIPSDWVAAAEPTDHHGWYWASDSFSGNATLTVGGVPKNPRSFDEVASFATGAVAYLGGFPGCGISLNNRLIYAADSYTVGTDAPPIRLFDGTSDRELIRLPKTAALVVPKAVLSMLATNGTIYLSSYDSGTTSADLAGRIFILDPQDTTLTPLGNDVFTAGQLPYALAWYNGSLWVGTHRQDGAQVGRLYRIRPGQETTWTLDHTFGAGEGCVASLASFQGSLYCGMTNAAGTFAKVFARDALGAFTTADTGVGGAATAGNGYPYLYVFGGNLYASFWNNDTPKIAKIRKYDGTSWTTAYTGSAGTLTPYIGMFEDSGYLFALGGGLLLQAALLRTQNGTSWTDLSAFLQGTATLVPCFGSLVL
jgi:hypothetical protein